MLPKRAYRELKAIILKDYGVELSDEEIVQKAHELIELHKIFRKSSSKVPSAILTKKNVNN